MRFFNSRDPLGVPEHDKDKPAKETAARSSRFFPRIVLNNCDAMWQGADGTGLYQ
jgi:hypothetical protein